VKAQTTFVWSYGIVKLHAVADVDLYLSGIVHPGYLERKDAVGFDHAFQQAVLFKLRMLVVDVSHTVQHFFDGLQVFGLSRMPGLQLTHELIDVHTMI